MATRRHVCFSAIHTREGSFRCVRETVSVVSRSQISCDFVKNENNFNVKRQRLRDGTKNKTIYVTAKVYQ